MRLPPNPTLRPLLATLLAIAPAAGAIAAAAAAPDAESARTEARLGYQRDLVNVLAPRADALPLLGAALLARPLGGQPKYHTFHSLIERAAQAPDATPAVQWARLVDCDARAGTCPNADALAALATQASDNAAVWLMQLARDTALGRDEAAAEDLRRAAGARLYDDYTGTALQALATTAGTLPAPAAAIDPATGAGAYGVQAVLVFGMAGLLPQPQPGMQAAARRCAKGRDDDAVREQCLRLAKVLEWGSSPLARSLGLHLRETLSEDPAVQQDARAERADLTWQVRSFGQLTARAAQDATTARQLLALARKGGTEMSLVLAALRGAGLPTTAPAEAPSPVPAAAASARTP